jgi:hypothetical protein
MAYAYCSSVFEPRHFAVDAAGDWRRGSNASQSAHDNADSELVAVVNLWRSFERCEYSLAGENCCKFSGRHIGYFLGDTWLFDTTRAYFASLPLPSTAPGRRAAHAAAALPSGTVVVFGGTNGTDHNDVWTWTPPSCSPACADGGLCTGAACVCTGTGYSGATCSTPVCSPACVNGGVCDAPNVCNCSSASSGGMRAFGSLCQVGAQRVCSRRWVVTCACVRAVLLR